MRGQWEAETKYKMLFLKREKQEMYAILFVSYTSIKKNL